MRFQFLLPLPQAHVYLFDPLFGHSEEFDEFVPPHMYKLDFLFWSGQRLLAVEIDGPSHIGEATQVVRERNLQRAGVTVIHIMNGEIFEFGSKVITELLPHDLMLFSERRVDAKSLKRSNLVMDPNAPPWFLAYRLL